MVLIHIDYVSQFMWYSPVFIETRNLLILDLSLLTFSGIIFSAKSGQN